MIKMQDQGGFEVPICSKTCQSLRKRLNHLRRTAPDEARLHRDVDRTSTTAASIPESGGARAVHDHAQNFLVSEVQAIEIADRKHGSDARRRCALSIAPGKRIAENGKWPSDANLNL